jgi:hypothetical protein
MAPRDAELHSYFYKINSRGAPSPKRLKADEGAGEGGANIRIETQGGGMLRPGDARRMHAADHPATERVALAGTAHGFVARRSVTLTLRPPRTDLAPTPISRAGRFFTRASREQHSATWSSEKGEHCYLAATASTTQREDLFKGKFIRRLVPPEQPHQVELRKMRVSDHRFEDFGFVHVNVLYEPAGSSNGPSQQCHPALTPEGLDPDHIDGAGPLVGDSSPSEYNLITNTSQIGEALDLVDRDDALPLGLASDSLLVSPPQTTAQAPLVAVSQESPDDRFVRLENQVQAQQVLLQAQAVRCQAQEARIQALEQELKRLSERAAPVRASPVAHAASLHPQDI